MRQQFLTRSRIQLTCVAHNCSALKHLFDSTISQALLFSTRKVYRVDFKKKIIKREKKNCINRYVQSFSTFEMNIFVKRTEIVIQVVIGHRQK